MPRYFFHRTDGVREPDRDGTELPDLHAARTHAVLYAATTLKDAPHEIWQGDDLNVEVTDGEGRLLFTIIMRAVVPILPPLRSTATPNAGPAKG